MIVLVTYPRLSHNTRPLTLCHTHRDKATAESSASALQEQKNSVSTRNTELEVEVRKLRKDLEEEREKPRVVPGDVSGERLSRLEVARVLRERNEYKEKYLSLLEQIR